MIVATRTPTTSTEQHVTRQQRSRRQQLFAFIWERSTSIALGTRFSLIGVPIVFAPGPPLPPGNGNNNWFGGNNNNNFNNGSIENIHCNEIMQIAGAPKNIMLTLVSFAVTRRAYGKICRKFTNYYLEKTGRNVRFRLSFGGSGTQARAVMDGLPADIAALALPLDILKIEERGLITPGWSKRLPNNSIACESVVSIVTRPGNPKNIRGWEDLARDDVSLVVANPKTAGVARWIFLGLWGHRLNKGDASAIEYVTKVFDNVVVMPRDAREASDVFYSQKMGDALLTYENEAIFTNLVITPKDPLPIISPDNNVRIVCPIALIDKNLESADDEVKESAQAFAEYVFTPESQKEFLAVGFRSGLVRGSDSDNNGMKLPEVKKVWDAEKRLGGWLFLQKKFFDEGGILSTIMNDVSKRKLAERLAAR